MLKAGWHCGGPPTPPGCGCSCGTCQLCVGGCACVADPSCNNNPPGCDPADMRGPGRGYPASAGRLRPSCKAPPKCDPSNKCTKCDGDTSTNQPLCTSCTPAGSACDGSGTCTAGKDLIGQICQSGRFQLNYQQEKAPDCLPLFCGAYIKYKVTGLAVNSCDSIDLVGAPVTEQVTKTGTCPSAKKVDPGKGGTVGQGNALDLTDTYGGCQALQLAPKSGYVSCQDVMTQKIFVGSCLAETHTITITIAADPKTGACLGGSVTRQ